MRRGCEFRPNTERILGVVQQKPQNDKRARRCYRCDPLGHVREHAPGADLALPCLASLLELQDVASLGSETSGLSPTDCHFDLFEGLPGGAAVKTTPFSGGANHFGTATLVVEQFRCPLMELLGTLNDLRSAAILE